MTEIRKGQNGLPKHRDSIETAYLPAFSAVCASVFANNRNFETALVPIFKIGVQENMPVGLLHITVQVLHRPRPPTGCGKREADRHGCLASSAFSACYGNFHIINAPCGHIRSRLLRGLRLRHVHHRHIPCPGPRHGQQTARRLPGKPNDHQRQVPGHDARHPT